MQSEFEDKSETACCFVKSQLLLWTSGYDFCFLHHVPASFAVMLRQWSGIFHLFFGKVWKSRFSPKWSLKLEFFQINWKYDLTKTKNAIEKLTHIGFTSIAVSKTRNFRVFDLCLASKKTEQPIFFNWLLFLFWVNK